MAPLRPPWPRPVLEPPPLRAVAGIAEARTGPPAPRGRACQLPAARASFFLARSFLFAALPDGWLKGEALPGADPPLSSSSSVEATRIIGPSSITRPPARLAEPNAPVKAASLSLDDAVKSAPAARPAPALRRRGAPREPAAQLLIVPLAMTRLGTRLVLLTPASVRSRVATFTQGPPLPLPVPVQVPVPVPAEPCLSLERRSTLEAAAAAERMARGMSDTASLCGADVSICTSD